jgi:hypothetical protein
MVVERVIKYYPVFLGCYYNETSHCLVKQYVNIRDIQMLTNIRIFENICHPNVKISATGFLLFVGRLPI